MSTSSLRRVDDPLSLLDDRLLAIVGARVPKVTIRAGSRDKVWFNAESRLAFDQKQTAYYSWSRNKTEANWKNFVRLCSAANRCYAQAKRAYHGRCQDALPNVSNHHSWWRTLKEHVLGVIPSIPFLLGPGGGLVTGCEERG